MQNTPPRACFLCSAPPLLSLTHQTCKTRLGGHVLHVQHVFFHPAPPSCLSRTALLTEDKEHAPRTCFLCLVHPHFFPKSQTQTTHLGGVSFVFGMFFMFGMSHYSPHAELKQDTPMGMFFVFGMCPSFPSLIHLSHPPKSGPPCQIWPPSHPFPYLKPALDTFLLVISFLDTSILGISFLDTSLLDISIFRFIYICVCVCVCVCISRNIHFIFKYLSDFNIWMANQISTWNRVILTGSDQFQPVPIGFWAVPGGTSQIPSGTDRNWSEPVGIWLVPPSIICSTFLTPTDSSGI